MRPSQPVKGRDGLAGELLKAIRANAERLDALGASGQPVELTMSWHPQMGRIGLTARAIYRLDAVTVGQAATSQNGVSAVRRHS